jgi:hypothetical protein
LPRQKKKLGAQQTDSFSPILSSQLSIGQITCIRHHFHPQTIAGDGRLQAGLLEFPTLFKPTLAFGFQLTLYLIIGIDPNAPRKPFNPKRCSEAIA